MSQGNMTVVMLEPGKSARITEIDASLAGMQKAVGNGWIEAIYPFEDPNCCLVCNEEGKLNGLPLNRALYDETGEQMFDIIAGPCFICDCSGEDFASLPEEKLQFYAEKFKLPELFFRLPNGKIKAVPYRPEEERDEEPLSDKIQSAKSQAQEQSADGIVNERDAER